MAFNFAPVVRDAEILARDIERTVAAFKRPHRHCYGEGLRKHAWLVLTTAEKTSWRPEERKELLGRLRNAIDELKAVLRLGKRLELFNSFGQFEAIYRLARRLGRQIGGWHKRYHPQGQSVQTTAPGQRAKTLSHAT
jgi:nucleoid DNA-binding protein